MFSCQPSRFSSQVDTKTQRLQSLQWKSKSWILAVLPEVLVRRAWKSLVERWKYGNWIISDANLATMIFEMVAMSFVFEDGTFWDNSSECILFLVGTRCFTLVFLNNDKSWQVATTWPASGGCQCQYLASWFYKELRLLIRMDVVSWRLLIGEYKVGKMCVLLSVPFLACSPKWQELGGGCRSGGGGIRQGASQVLRVRFLASRHSKYHQVLGIKSTIWRWTSISWNPDQLYSREIRWTHSTKKKNSPSPSV